MSAQLNEVVLHINENLDDDALRRLEDGVREVEGVISVGHNQGQSHMVMVVYDSEATRASSILHSFRDRGLHAQVVGM
jgi:hypothetical protein